MLVARLMMETLCRNGGGVPNRIAVGWLRLIIFFCEV